VIPRGDSCHGVSIATRASGRKTEHADPGLEPLRWNPGER
jgi:hypothetical protein